MERCQRIHREKLATMKSTATEPRLRTMDNRTPHTMHMTHLTHRLKKAQLEEERFQEIELENKVGAGRGSGSHSLPTQNTFLLHSLAFQLCPRRQYIVRRVRVLSPELRVRD